MMVDDYDDSSSTAGPTGPAGTCVCAGLHWRFHRGNIDLEVRCPVHGNDVCHLGGGSRRYLRDDSGTGRPRWVQGRSRLPAWADNHHHYGGRRRVAFRHNTAAVVDAPTLVTRLVGASASTRYRVGVL